MGSRVFCALLMLLSALPVAAASIDASPVVARATSQLCDKQVVVLAELPSHGEGHAFAIKADIVKALVQQCGFKALVFEAPIYDFIGLESRWGKGAQQRELDQAVGKFWWARELARWRTWLFEQADGNRLVLGGMDDQISATSEYARANLPSLTSTSVPKTAEDACRASVQRNVAWSYDAANPFDDAEKTLLRRCAEDAAMSAQALSGPGPLRGDQIMSANFARYVDRQTEQEGAMARDEAMFRNVLWYLAREPAGTKLIVWTATVHASKQQGDRSDAPLGTLLQAQLGKRLGVIGFTALAGQSSMAGQPAKTLTPTPPDSLERRAIGPGSELAYLDTSALAAMGPVESRLLGKLSRADWSIRFDAVIVVANEVAPTFEVQP
jgi:erythromycin esterase-like protein